MRWALNQRQSLGVYHVRLIYVHLAYILRAPDLIVSAGGNTSLRMRAGATDLGVNNFFMGSLRGLDAALFNTVFTLRAAARSPMVALPK